MRPENKYLADYLIEEINDSKAFFVTSYLGLNSEKLNSLRNECRKADCKYLVVKNRVFMKALGQAGVKMNDTADQAFQESTAIAFSKQDAVAVAKMLVKFGKDNNDLPKIKGGYLEGQWFDEKGVESFSKLPSREVLLAKLMGVMKAPLNNFVSVLSAPLRNYVCCLKQVGEKKQNS
ncbi:MAG: 50S ribosomal protein L10 [Candidatus Auribacterota bacterium]